MTVVFDLDIFNAIPGAATATVTPLGGVAVSTVVQWDQVQGSPSDHAVGAGPAASTNRRIIAYVRRDHVPNLPVGSTIVGGPAHRQGSWKVITVDPSDPEYHIVAVL